MWPWQWMNFTLINIERKQPTSLQLGLSHDVIISLDKMAWHQLFFQKNIFNFYGFLQIYLGIYLAVNVHKFLFFLQCQIVII